MEADKRQFKHNDIVWAKVMGHPWWPGVINEEKSGDKLNVYRVDFFGHPPTHSLLTSNKIMKYEDYEATHGIQNTGKTSSALKKAITQATTMFKTLQHAKNSPIHNTLSQQCVYETQNTVLTSPCRAEQKSSTFQKIANQHQQSNIGFSQDIEPSVQKTKKIKKPASKPQPKKIKAENQKTQKFNKQLQQILKSNRLDNIPDITKKRSEKVDAKIVKFLYRVFRKRHSRPQSIQMALNWKGKINNKQEMLVAIDRPLILDSQNVEASID